MSSNITDTKCNLLSQISQNTEEIRNLSMAELENLADDLRDFTIQSVSKTGGHLGAGLGVIELTVALHHVFHTPKDILVWDIGHQCYPHKILTGRMHQMENLRKENGISGFLRRQESVFDAFGAGHSSTSISAALGMAKARDISGQNHEIVAIIGDGSISAGMAYEAMNNAGASKSRLILILNDNDMSIAKPTGAMSNYLSKFLASKSYFKIREKGKDFLKKMPSFCEEMAKSTEKYAKSMVFSGNLFEDLGFYYIGPINGHDLPELVKIFQNVRENNAVSGPILIHVKTNKGQGFNSSENSDEKFHAVGKFDGATLKQFASNAKMSYTHIFAQTLLEMAEKDEKIFAITAAMPSGTGLDKFAAKFPEKFADVGIAEQHAVTFAAGLACEGFKPFVAIYSTFLQRAYDQVVHDVAIQSLPVRFVIDRAGYVGADGATHAGSFDLVFLSCLPNFIIMAPSDGNELRKMLNLMQEIDHCPSAIRYPRGEAHSFAENDEKIEIGKGRIVQKGKKLAIISLGTRLEEVMKAAEILEEMHQITPTIMDARFAKPLDEQLILSIAQTHDAIITIEEGSIGGFGSHILHLLTSKNVIKKFVSLFYPDQFLEQATQESLHEKSGLNSSGIVKAALKLMEKISG